jgi:GNAT superfamily N-acetyltransferase
MLIRPLSPIKDRAAVSALLTAAADYYDLWLHRAPAEAEVEDVFTAAPPGCDPAASHRIGLWLDGALSGVAELSFGFPNPGDAYLGLMILAPHVRRAGHGRRLLTHVETLARTAAAQHLYLAVLGANTAGRAFWQAQGFTPTGVHRHDADTGHLIHRLVKPL